MIDNYKLLEQKRKNHFFRVFVSLEQKEIIKRNAELNGYKNVSSFLRSMAINDYPVFIDKFNKLYKKVMEDSINGGK